VRVAVAVVLLLILWSAFASIDEVTRGEGKVIPSRQLQVVQSLDGGVVSEILVREGQEVDAGQMLLRIDETRATSGVRESAAQAFALRAKPGPPARAGRGQGLPAAGGPCGRCRRAAHHRRGAQSLPIAGVGAQLQHIDQPPATAAAEQELTEARARRAAAPAHAGISRQELTKTRPLLATGAVSEVDMLRLERDVSRTGRREQPAHRSPGCRPPSARHSARSQEIELTFRNEARKELSECWAS
jgi:adhesin transport system membrane fusion protein